jgi:dephospho-CoA kinase
MLIIGLTGAMGAGKSSLSHFFRYLGIPVHCADTFIHFLFRKDEEVREQVKSLWPDVFVEGQIDRLLLGKHVLSSPSDLNKLEGLLYPKLAAGQKKFLKKKQFLKEPYVVLDVPLLFEVGLEFYCDCVIIASAPLLLRKYRVTHRTGMSVKKFYTFENLQMKEAERRKRADFIVYTGRDKANALKTIKQVLFTLSHKPFPKWDGKWPKKLTRNPYESKNCFRYRNNRF